MPVVKRFPDGLAIYVYASPREHPPPHFHVVGPDVDVAVAMRTLTVIRGRYRMQDLREALAWAAANEAVLTTAWETYNERG